MSQFFVFKSYGKAFRTPFSQTLLQFSKQIQRDSYNKYLNTQPTKTPEICAFSTPKIEVIQMMLQNEPCH
jgi:hypothetical protein